MVVFYTSVFNGEKTLTTAIESILSQTYTDFVYYILDNASTDRTGEIIQQYADIDHRIVKLQNKINNPYEICSLLPNLFLKKHKDAYFANLDADDIYSPDFLENMIPFMQKNRLDIAACGSDFVNTQDGKTVGSRKLGQNLILEGTDFGLYFPSYHQFMRTVWGKVFSLSAFHGLAFHQILTQSYGGDTLLNMLAFRNASRVGVLAGSLHKYYISHKSVSYRFDNNRVQSDSMLFEAANDFLKDKVGTISDENQTFLWCVYFNSIVDTTNTLLNTQIGVSEKLCNLLKIVQCPYTQSCIKLSMLGEQKNRLFAQIGLWVLSQKEVQNSQNIDIAIDILAMIGAFPNRLDGWEPCWKFWLLVNLKKKWRQKNLPSNANTQIVDAVQNFPFLSGLSADFLMYFSEIIFSILQHKEEAALQRTQEFLEHDADIPDTYMESLLTLGLNLAAMLKRSDDFVSFEKRKIAFFIQSSKMEKARLELADWDEILPDDRDFKDFRKRLAQ